MLIEDLSFEQFKLRAEILDHFSSGCERVQLPTAKYCAKLKRTVSDVNAAVASITMENITNTNALIYSAVSVVLNRMNIKQVNKQPKQFVPALKLRLLTKLRWLRVHLSQMTAYSQGRIHRHSFIESLYRRYHMSDRSPAVVESLKLQVVAISERIARYTMNDPKRFGNSKFYKNQKTFFCRFSGDTKSEL